MMAIFTISGMILCLDASTSTTIIINIILSGTIVEYYEESIAIIKLVPDSQSLLFFFYILSISIINFQLFIVCCAT